MLNYVYKFRLYAPFYFHLHVPNSCPSLYVKPSKELPYTALRQTPALIENTTYPYVIYLLPSQPHLEFSPIMTIFQILLVFLQFSFTSMAVYMLRHFNGTQLLFTRLPIYHNNRCSHLLLSLVTINF